MEVDFAFIADAAEIVNGKAYVMGGAFDTIWTSQMPIEHPALSLVLRLKLSPAELDRKHKLEINLIDEDGQRINSISGDIEIGRNPELPKGWQQSFMMTVNFKNISFKRFGDFSFEILVNSSSLKAIPLRLAKRSGFLSQ